MIKKIFDEISAEQSTNEKMVILSKYKDNALLKRVLYLANSKRVKFYIKQIPQYKPSIDPNLHLGDALKQLEVISNREVTGHEASNYLRSTLSCLSYDEAYIVERIIEKDCKIGMGTSFINKVFPKLIEDTPYMGAKSFDEKLARKIFEKGKSAYSQIKMDGRYCNAIIRNGDVELESRQGEATILTGAKFIDELSKFPDFVLNGELTMDGVPRYESNGIISSLIDIQSKRDERKETETLKKIKAFEEKHGSFEEALNKVRYTIWDVINVNEYFDKKSKTPYNFRLNDASTLVKSSKATMVRLIESKEVKTYAEAMEHFQEVLATEVDGVPQEGTILKAWGGEWKDGKPNWQIKMKLEMDVDLRITGFNYGDKGTKNEHLISSFNAESSDGLVKTRPQGLKENMMEYVTKNQKELLGKVLQCRCNGLSKNSKGAYSLLYPAFVELRTDKDTCDSLESIKEIENMVKTLTVN